MLEFTLVAEPLARVGRGHDHGAIPDKERLQMIERLIDGRDRRGAEK
jgi:hypothetical protein